MTTLTISPDAARNSAIACQFGSTSHKKTLTIPQWISHLGYLQIDTISVVQRAHHHTLWSRIPDYKTDDIDDFFWKDRRLFEFPAHASACILPLSDYPVYRTVMERPIARDKVWGSWSEANKTLLNRILERLKLEGPLRVSDFEESVKSGSWEWRPVKMGLELLLRQGRIMVCGRKGFQRVYDLSERVLPDWVNTSPVTEPELLEFLVKKTLQAHGFATQRTIIDHMRLASTPAMKKTIQLLLKKKEIIELNIHGQEEPRYYAFSGFNPDVPEAKGIRILSPFDNFTVIRNRLERLFDFTYRLECYYPAAKRKFGYFVMPVLWNDAFIARLDAKADRKSSTLICKRIHFERSPEELVIREFASGLKRFARWNDCIRIKLEMVTPKSMKQPLSCYLQGEF